MGQHIFTNQTPALNNQNDGSDITVSTVFRSDTDGFINGIRWFAPVTLPSQAPIGVLYSFGSPGSELARVTFNLGSMVAGDWNIALFGASVSIVASTLYVAALWTPDHYTATAGFFSSSGVTNGHLTAIQDGSPSNNGLFREPSGGVPTYPTGTFNGGFYFVDVDFSVTAGGGTVVLGQATETDTANPMTKNKVYVLGEPTEADMANSFGRPTSGARIVTGLGSARTVAGQSGARIVGGLA